MESISQSTDLFSLQGHSIVVTGGAGYLGREICASLRDRGAHVLCVSSRIGTFAPPSSSEQVGSITSEICDLNDEGAFAETIAPFAGAHGGLTGLVNCAVRASRGIDLEMSKEDLEETLQGVFVHYFTCARTALRSFGETPGSIVNIASIWGLVSPDSRIYLDLKNEPSLGLPPSEAAILQLTKYMATLLAPRGIRVNAVVPGWFPKKRGPERPDYLAEIESRVPMGRIGRPSDIVGAVIYLLSGASSYMTGQQMVIDGGYTLW
jgi:NAD(P)-dependent dehydrogenase (short-subunit alcohol dehydrogenase family)